MHIRFQTRDTITPVPKKFSLPHVSSTKQKGSQATKGSSLKFQPTNFSVISAQGPTPNDRDLRSYWNGQAAESEFVVTHRGHLSLDLLQYLFSLHYAKLVVPFDEYKISEDILSINTVFICRIQRRRAARYTRESQNKQYEVMTIAACNKRRRLEETLNRRLLVKVYPNRPQKQLLKGIVVESFLCLVSSHFVNACLCISTQGSGDIGRIVRLCNYMDDLSSEIVKVAISASKRKKHKASERRSCSSLELDVIVILSFEVSDMTNHKGRKTTQKTLENALGTISFPSTSDRQGRGVERCSGNGNIESGRSEMYNSRNCGTAIDRDENRPRGSLPAHALLGVKETVCPPRSGCRRRICSVGSHRFLPLDSLNIMLNFLPS
ncbi:hypothetical protein G9A89_014755 [Geosiphon pyriformis]|nr:hypothetical protein G9A89_014755 [Geosiphon pyriformis]